MYLFLKHLHRQNLIQCLANNSLLNFITLHILNWTLHVSLVVFFLAFFILSSLLPSFKLLNFCTTTAGSEGNCLSFVVPLNNNKAILILFTQVQNFVLSCHPQFCSISSWPIRMEMGCCVYGQKIKTLFRFSVQYLLGTTATLLSFLLFLWAGGQFITGAPDVLTPDKRMPKTLSGMYYSIPKINKSIPVFPELHSKLH